MSREVIRDSVVYLPAKVIPAIVGVISIPILTRMLTPEQYGQYVLALTSLSLISALCLSWLASVTIRFYAVYGVRRLFNSSWPLLISSLLLGSALWICIAMLLGKELAATLFVVSGVLWILANGSFEYFSSWLRVRNHPKLYSLAHSWRSAGGLAMATLLLAVEFKGGGAVVILAMTIAMLSAVAIIPYFALRNIEQSGSSSHENESISPILLKYGMPAALANFLIAGLSFIDRFIVEAHLGATALAVYGASYDLAEKTVFFANSILLLSSSVISFRIFENEGECKAIEFLSRLMRLYLLVAPPLVMALIIFAPSILNMILPPQYAQGSLIVPFVASGGLCVGIMHRYTLVLAFHKRTDLIMWCSGGALLTNLFLCLILIPLMGLIGAAISTFVAYATWLFLVRLAAMKYQCPKFPWITLLRVSAALCISGGVLQAIHSGTFSASPAVLLALFAIGMAIYALCLVLTRELTPRDIKVAANLFRSTLT